MGALRAALGLKTHSGWAALVVLGASGDQLHVIDRRRLELVTEGDEVWARQPYHAAEELEPAAARGVVKRGIAAARQNAAREMRTVVKRTRAAKHEIVACAVLVGDPMPDWSVEEILSVHFRMHKAEGALFQDVLGAAAKSAESPSRRSPSSGWARRPGRRSGPGRARSSSGSPCSGNRPARPGGRTRRKRPSPPRWRCGIPKMTD